MIEGAIISIAHNRVEGYVTYFVEQLDYSNYRWLCVIDRKRQELIDRYSNASQKFGQFRTAVAVVTDFIDSYHLKEKRG